MNFLKCLALWPTLSFAQITQVFVGTGADGIYETKLNEADGSLSQPVRVVDVEGANFLTLDPEGENLYATANLPEKKGGVISYRVQGDALVETGRQAYPGRRLVHVSLDQKNEVLLAADYGAGWMTSFSIKKDRSLGELVSYIKHEGSSVNPKRQRSPHPHSAYVGPDNRFVYVPDLGVDQVKIYSLESGIGVLAEVSFAKVAPGSGPRHMKFSRNGEQAYVLNEMALTITIFDRDQKTGGLSEKQTIKVLPEDAETEKMSCSEIQVSKDGRFVYCANRNLSGEKRDSVSVFSVGEEGRLTWLQTAPAEVHIPRHINLTPSGEYLLVCGQKSNELVVLKIDQKSGRTSSTGSKVTIPKAMCVVFP